MILYERNNIKNNINLSCDVIVKKFNIEDNLKNEVGNGVCHLTNEGLSFKGNLNVKEFTHKLEQLPGLAFSAGEEFECYYNNELYYFYPVENRSQCAKWSLIIDELNKMGDLNE